MSTTTSSTAGTVTTTAASTGRRPRPARDRLLDAATRLFYEEGIHSVGVDRVLEEAGVTRATLYKWFAGKEDLVLAYLQGEDAGIRGLFEGAVGVTSDPDELLALTIAAIAGDVRDHHTRGCPFINAAAEYPDGDGAVRHLITEHREWFRATLEQLAAGAGLDEPAQVAASLVLLRDAALVGGYLDGDDRVAPAFERTATAVIASHRPR